MPSKDLLRNGNIKRDKCSHGVACIRILCCLLSIKGEENILNLVHACVNLNAILNYILDLEI